LRIAFHTPLNAYDDGRISGDRRMARQFIAIMEGLGHEVLPIRDGRTYLREPDEAAFAALCAGAEARIEALLSGWRATGGAPDLWFTYHSYYKAPDLLGPAVAARLAIPYVVAEASDSERRAEGGWAAQVACARASFGRAAVHFCFTARDREGISPWCGRATRFVDLPPFIEAAGARSPGPRRNDPPHLVAIGMMRPGNKHESYLALADVMQRLLDRPWRLSLFGDGAMRADIEAAYAAFPPGRVTFHGAVERELVAGTMAQADIFVWPGLREAYGLVFLEAQAAGLPVVAFDSGGVPATLKRDDTGLLVPEGDIAGLARTLGELLDDPGRRRRMGTAAARFVANERGMDRARDIVARGLALALGRTP
jgi:glycosyltransferase involved in cell wall biosynthesis